MAKILPKKQVRKRSSLKEIRVCDNCETPLISTFAFQGCEWFCLNCGTKGPLFGTGKDTPTTQKLVFIQKLVENIWKVLYGRMGFIPLGSRRVGCKKCAAGHSHSSHLTASERERDALARKFLMKCHGFITPPYK